MPLRSYIAFARVNVRFVSFGFLVACASSFGQTYFIGVFGPGLQAEFGLSHTLWGSIYMAGTLASAALLPFTGKLIDRVELRLYAAAVCTTFAIACLAMASVSGVAGLIVAGALLRQGGQGLMSHVAITSMARDFHAP